MFGFLKEFRDFINKGNLLGLAIAFVMGAAFGGVVNSLVDNIIMPIAAIPFGEPNFDSAMVLTINGAEIRFGAFLTSLVTFLLIGFTVFLILKAYSKLTGTVTAAGKDELGLLSDLVEEMKGLRTDLAEGQSTSGS